MSACVVPRLGPDTAPQRVVKPMARKPNYDFERKERERLKNEKKAARASEKVKLAPTADAGPEESEKVPPAKS